MHSFQSFQWGLDVKYLISNEVLDRYRCQQAEPPGRITWARWFGSLAHVELSFPLALVSTDRPLVY